ncbi:hypothetical protein SNE510_07580 [Streptomyces sp. NE5-10]|nr:hypothetical protein SNE510_07580 [Streptomyces sp. NE5-10]
MTKLAPGADGRRPPARHRPLGRRRVRGRPGGEFAGYDARDLGHARGHGARPSRGPFPSRRVAARTRASRASGPADQGPDGPRSGFEKPRRRTARSVSRVPGGPERR